MLLLLLSLVLWLSLWYIIVSDKVSTRLTFGVQVNATENSLTVECFEGAWNGGGNELSALSFVAELYRSDENDLKNGVAFGPMIANVTVKGSTTSASTGLPSVPVFVFNDLPRIDDHTSIASGRNDVGYRVHIYARNHKGRSPVTTLIVHLLNPSKYQTKREYIVHDSFY